MADTILDKASAKYPFINRLGIVANTNPQSSEDYAETWPAGEEGSEDNPRPAYFPIDKPGIDIYKPDQFNEDDLAGEAMHVDPEARKTSGLLLNSLNNDQIEALKKESLDYQQSVKEGLPASRALQNAADSLIRGYVVGQWPQKALDNIGLNQKQQMLLNNLKEYATTGMTADEQMAAAYEKAKNK